MRKITEYILRFRTWIFNLALAALAIAPEVMNSPEILAIVPYEYQRYFLAALFLVNIWMRPWPAVLPSDPEAQKK